jgi:hypothetical protein
MPHWADSSAGFVVRAGFAEATCTPRGWHVSGACYKLAGEGMWTAVLAGTCVIVQATQCHCANDTVQQVARLILNLHHAVLWQPGFCTR